MPVSVVPLPPTIKLVVLAVPTTSNFVFGLVMPTPTFPLDCCTKSWFVPTVNPCPLAIVDVPVVPERVRVPVAVMLATLVMLPEMSALPWRPNNEVGVVVPMPRFPLLSIRIRSDPAVEKLIVSAPEDQMPLLRSPVNV